MSRYAILRRALSSSGRRIIGPSIPRRRNVVDLVARSLAHGTAFCRTASVSGGPGAPKNISCRSRRSRTSTRVSSSGKYPGHNQYRRRGTNGQNDQFCTHHNFSAPPGVAKRIRVILLIKAAGSLALQHAASFEAMKGRFGSKFSRTTRSPPAAVPGAGADRPSRAAAGDR